MIVKRAEHAGACFGVERALRLAGQTLETSSRVWTLGSLIHNPTVVASLERQGARCLDDLGESASGDTLIVRSHGTTPSVLAQAKERGLTVVDATCPHVAHAQHAAYELGEMGGSVVIVGEQGHPEVEALAAWAAEAGATCYIVSCADEVEQDIADLKEPIGVVAQTTQTRENLNSVVGALTARGRTPIVRDTLCFATQQRQQAARMLANDVDAMVVVGGHNSANTQRLAEICAAQGCTTYAIETIDELDPAWFEGVEVVGVSAGASTPEDQIGDAVRFLESLQVK